MGTIHDYDNGDNVQDYKPYDDEDEDDDEDEVLLRQNWKTFSSILSTTKCPSQSWDSTKFSLHKNSLLETLSTFLLKSWTKTWVLGLPPFLLLASTPAVNIGDILPGASGQYSRGPSIRITSQSNS